MASRTRSARPARLIPAVVLSIAILLGALGGFLVAKSSPKRYTATSTQYMVISGVKTADQLASMNTVLNQQVTSYESLVTSSAVLDPVVGSLHLSESSTDLAAKVFTDVSPGTTLLAISVTDTDRQRAYDIVNAVAQSAAQHIPDIQDFNGVATLRLVQVGKPVLPSAPNSPSTGIDAIIGAVLAGLLAYLCMAFVLGLVRVPGRRSAAKVPSMNRRESREEEDGVGAHVVSEERNS